MPAIAATYADPNNTKITWYGDKGVQKFRTWDSFVKGVLERIPASWPGFNVAPIETIMETEDKLMMKMRVTSENGMDVETFHLWEFNAQGKMLAWTGFDDGFALKKYNVQQE